MNTLTALVLILLPPETPTPQALCCLNDLLANFSVKAELMDKNESWIFKERKHFQKDLDIIRRRFRELEDTPTTEAAQAFPPVEHINNAIQFNRSFHHHLKNQELLFPSKRQEYREAIEETEFLYQIYSAMADAKTSCNALRITCPLQSTSSHDNGIY